MSTPDPTPPSSRSCGPDRCPLCGGPNACRVASSDPYKGPCWCERRSFPEALLARVSGESAARACVCQRCLAAALAEENAVHAPDAPDAGAGDYYLDPATGYRVFTAEYLRRRGHCCDSGCRHCPWEPRHASPVSGDFLSGWLPLLLLLLSLALTPVSGMGLAVTLTEEFDSNPLERGWTVSGRADLFTWNPALQRLEVTWDSSAPHSLFALPLGETLTTNETFAFGLDLVLTEAVGGARPPRTGAMQVAFGLLDLERARSEHYPRSAGRAFDLVEFNWFPEGEIPGFGVVDPTVSPVLFDSAGRIAAAFTFPLDLPLEVLHRIRCEFHPKLRELRTTLISGGVEQAVRTVKLPAAFADFSLNAFAVMNWSEADNPFDSLLARGHVDRIVVELPAPPIGQIEMPEPGHVSFMNVEGWRYDVEASEDLVDWQIIGSISGSGVRSTVPDNRAISSGVQFYRVRATRRPKPDSIAPP